jgi:electron transfer flavoprotein alpha subunit
VTVLAFVEMEGAAPSQSGLEALAAARRLAGRMGQEAHALVIGSAPDDPAALGVDVVNVAEHELLSDYGPEAWGETLAQGVTSIAPTAVVATGSERGNEVLAQAAARLGLPFAANCLSVDPGPPWKIARVRWGGSLIEDAELASTSTAIVSFAERAVAPDGVTRGAELRMLAPRLDPSLARTIVRSREIRSEGVTLATARVVVGGGRGVGSAEGFADLEKLAGLLGGVVGCSRVATNNGWRPHSDQVGQTGTRIAPQLYMACGISGAIQHWVGAMGAKHILAINTDRQANMVAKADYAVIGDLHDVLPAIVAEVERRRS